MKPRRAGKPQWGMGKLFSSRATDVPPEFDVADTKIKELHQMMTDLQKYVRKYLKSLVAYASTTVSLSNQFQEFGSFLHEQGDIGQLVGISFIFIVLGTAFLAKEATLRGPKRVGQVMRKLTEAAVATSVSYNDFREKIETGFMNKTEIFIQEVVHPAREAKRLWQKSRSDYDGCRQKLDMVLRQLSVTGHPEPIKLLQAQIQSQLARLKEQERFESASDALGDALWMRDFRFFQHQAEFMMEVHDTTLSTYSHYFAMEEFIANTKHSMEQKRIKFNHRKEELQLARAHEEEEQEFVKFVPLVELLSAEDLALVQAISMTAGADQDQILTSVIRILDAHQRTMPIIKLAITNEVESTNSASTLFRGNSVSTKLMSQFTKLHGLSYLEVIRSNIQEILQNQSSLEVDPDKAEGQDVASNMVRLKSICKRLLDVIITSVAACPVPFRQISARLQQDVLQRFPNAGVAAVAGFLFLRFFGPAILSPEVNGLLDQSEMNAKSRRALVLVSKVVQNAANGVKFGSKEMFMSDMNDLIETYIPQLHSFMAEIADYPKEDEYVPVCTLEEAKNIELPKLHLKIVQNLVKICKSLQTSKQDAIIDTVLAVIGELGEVDVEIEVESKKKKH